jgi:predicted neuraminidase
MWESGEGNAHMLLRSTAGSIFRTDTSNYGDSWSEAYPISLPNNNSGIDVARLNKVIFLVYNPVSGNWAARTPLSISVSDDNGLTWSKAVNIASGEGSFSYPSIVVLQDQSLGITYTWNRVSIVFVKIKLS